MSAWTSVWMFVWCPVMDWLPIRAIKNQSTSEPWDLYEVLLLHNTTEKINNKRVSKHGVLISRFRPECGHYSSTETADDSQPISKDIIQYIQHSTTQTHGEQPHQRCWRGPHFPSHNHWCNTIQRSSSAENFYVKLW